MENYASNPMTYKKFHLALLRPAILQALRAQGYYTCKPSVLEFFTEIVADYIYNTATATRNAMEHNHPDTPEVTLPDLRQGLEYMGAFTRDENKREDRNFDGDPELRGIQNFKDWFDGKQNQRMTRIAEAFNQTGLLLEAAPLEEGQKVEKPPIDYLSRKLRMSRIEGAMLIVTAQNSRGSTARTMILGMLAPFWESPATTARFWSRAAPSRASTSGGR